MINKLLMMLLIVSSFAQAQEGTGDSDHGGPDGCGVNCVRVPGPRPTPPPHHPGDGNRPGHPGGGGPQPNDTQRLSLVARHSFLTWNNNQSELDFCIFLWNERNIIDFGGGYAVEEARAKMKGAVLGHYSSPGARYEEAEDRMQVRIDSNYPITFHGVSIPLKVTTITIEHRHDGLGNDRLMIMPKDLVQEYMFASYFYNADEYQRAIQKMLNGARLADVIRTEGHPTRPGLPVLPRPPRL